MVVHAEYGLKVTHAVHEVVIVEEVEGILSIQENTVLVYPVL